jgi:diacylglycerol kinase family enzyme
LGISKHIVTAARDCLHGSEHPLDLGCINGRYFSYVASFGAFTESSYNTPQSLKNALGHLAYVLEGAKDLLNLQPSHLSLTVDGEALEGDYIFGAISNTTSIGGVLRLNEALVRLNDGKLELMLIRAPKTLQEISECLLAVQKQQYNSAMMTFCCASGITVEADRAMPWSLDGEKEEGHTFVKIKNLQKRISIIQ